MKDVEKIKPTGLFTNYIFKAIPLAFDESLSYYECLCGLLSYLKETVIPTVNNNADAIVEVQNLMTQLQNYVDNYFNNLDVQNEINNKLDEMTEDGTLTLLIKNYIDPLYQAYETEINNNINNFKSNVNTELSAMNTKINQATSGSPLVASSTSEMTDTSRIYVNTTDGKWYYYNGTSWEIGGTYQATGIADGSVSPEDTNFLKSIHLNYFKVNKNLSDYNGLTFNVDYYGGKIKINGTCLNTINLKIGAEIDYYLDKGTYKFDLNVLDGTVSENLGVSIFGENENKETVTILNVSTSALPATINLTEKVKISNINLWIVTDRVFNDYLIYPQFQKTDNITNNYPYELYDFKNSYLDTTFNNKIQDFLDNKNNTLILSPSKVRYIPNKELSLYYNNLLYNGIEKQIYNHQCYNNFTMYDNCFRFNKSNVTNYYERLIFNKLDINHTQFYKDITFVGVNTNAGNGITKKCLFIGDSLTNAGHYTQDLLDLFNDDVMNIELLGTRGTGTNKHEGRNNWTAYSYTHKATYTDLPNPFWNSTTSSFDFSKYMVDNSYNSVDIVGIALGTNDRGVIGSTEEQFKTNLQTMIDSIHDFNSNIKIVLFLTPPVCSVGYDYIAWNMSIKLANKTIIDNFNNKENQNIFIAPTGLNIDPINDYTMKQIPLNSATTITKTVVNDPIHPNETGYQHIADALYPLIKYFGQ